MAFYEPVQDDRYFERDMLYRQINWASLGEVIDAFSRRIEGWYIEPIRVVLECGLAPADRETVRRLTGRRDGGHYAFATMAMTCLLIDALSQYRYGELSSSGNHFKRFIREVLPSYKGTLPASIWHYDHSRQRKKGVELVDYADVIWNGHRCGILHQAHAPLYCGTNPGNEQPVVEQTGAAVYASHVGGGSCPGVIIYPEHLFSEVAAFFTDYLKNLKDKSAANEPLRDDFKKKFSDSFGIDISNASL